MLAGFGGFEAYPIKAKLCVKSNQEDSLSTSESVHLRKTYIGNIEFCAMWVKDDIDWSNLFLPSKMFWTYPEWVTDAGPEPKEQ